MNQLWALRVIGEFAADQWGLITAAQAAELGVQRVTLTRLTASGLLEHVTRAVYCIPAAATAPHLMDKAAWLRLDPSRPAWQRDPLDSAGGVISHRSAAAMHDLGDVIPVAVELTVPRRRTTRDRGVRLRTGVLAGRDVTTVDGLPVTTAERTVLDLLADHTDGGQVAGVLVAALRRRLVDIGRLGDRAEAHAARYGVTGGVRPGHRLVERLLEETGYGGHGEHDRRLASLARQLEGLDPAQLRGMSEALHEIQGSERECGNELPHSPRTAACPQRPRPPHRDTGRPGAAAVPLRPPAGQGLPR